MLPTAMPPDLHFSFVLYTLGLVVWSLTTLSHTPPVPYSGVYRAGTALTFPFIPFPCAQFLLHRFAVAALHFSNGLFYY